MKTGITLEEFSAEIARRKASKIDYVATTDALGFHTGDNHQSVLLVGDEAQHGYGVNEHAHSQIASRLSIPKTYYDRLRASAPALLDANVGHWFHANPERRLVRVLDGKVRAFLSDRYQRIDNHDVLDAIDQPLTHLGMEYGARVESLQITDTRMYLKVVVPGIEAEIQTGDIVQAGFVIENSEVGMGAFSVKTMLYRLICLNGMITGSELRRAHIGRRITTDGDQTVWSDATRKADDQTILLAAKDIVAAAVNETRFNALVARMRESVNTAPSLDPVKTVERLADTHNLAEGEQGKVLSFFVRDAAQNGLGLYGALNAVTRASQEVEDYARATELEELGGKLLDTTATEWNTLAGITSR